MDRPTLPKRVKSGKAPGSANARNRAIGSGSIRPQKGLLGRLTISRYHGFKRGKPRVTLRRSNLWLGSYNRLHTRYRHTTLLHHALIINHQRSTLTAIPHRMATLLLLPSEEHSRRFAFLQWNPDISLSVVSWGCGCIEDQFSMPSCYKIPENGST